jgi:hypothetical protein
MRFRRASLRCFPALGAALALGVVTASASQTGVPVDLKIDPASIRQANRNTSQVVASVTLKAPAPDFFICDVRSADASKIKFSSILFVKGQLKGKGSGTVFWDNVPQDCTVKVGAFSINRPDQEIWFTVSLKVLDETSSP